MVPPLCREPEEAIGSLMEVLRARHPTSRVGILTTQQGHDLAEGLEVPLSPVLTCCWLGISLPNKLIGCH